jgi:enediyne biosynthesis protein E5
MQPIFFKDARYFQIIFQVIFLSYGLLYLHWQANWWLYATYFITSIGIQFVCEVGRKKINAPLFSKIWWQYFANGLPSVYISSLGLCLLLKTNHLYVAIFAASISIASKYILRVNKKHVFNPSAIGIVAAIFLTDKAWFSPGQWGSSMVILFACICLGSIVVTKVQKLDVSIAFLGSFATLLFIRQIIFLGWPIDFFVQSISTGSILLFSFFMITDPKTTPNHVIARTVWSVLIGGISFYLTVFKFINGAPIIVLVCMQPLVPLLNYLCKANSFKWQYQQLPFSFGLKKQHQSLPFL